MSNPLFPVLPICNALAIVLVLLPVSWHWKAKNTGTLLYIGWTVLGNLNFMINTIVWRGSYEDLAPHWCDISSKIVIGQSVGLTAASLCINRKLYNIATIQSVSITPASRRRTMMVDLFLGIVFPIIVMGLHYIVQPTRYNIIENIGCWPNIYNSLLAIPMVFMWPIIISCASFIYCSLSIRGFLKARQQFNQVLNNSGSGINMSRYFRLMALASEEMLFSIPFASYLLKQNLTLAKQVPWTSWADTHQYYDTTIWKSPWILIKANQPSFNAVMVSLWVLPAGGYLFFIWFGLGGEAFAAYKSMFYTVMKPFGIKPKPKAAPTSKWQNQQLVSNTSSMPAQDRVILSSIPDLDESGEKGALNDDLEAGKIHAHAV
ncbi:a-factor receptor [Ceratobasidium sp. 423]|nr:a-factor receptor [Ceratobasidium sp. 423]